MQDKKIVPLKKAAAIILISMLCFGSMAGGGLLFFWHLKKTHMHHEKFTIAAIAQTCSGNERLKTVYLAELLELSVDRPCNFYEYDLVKAENRLKSNPLIKSATVKKIPPKTVYVDYALRQPIAFLGDYSNTAIDSEGYLFPFKPFFTPKSLPEIVIGLTGFGEASGSADSGCWGKPLQGRRAQLALKIYHLVQKHCCQGGTTKLVKIDTSKAYALSYGQRQIVIVLEDTIIKESQTDSILYIYPKILRLSTHRNSQEIANYLVLNKSLLKEASKVAVSTKEKTIRMPATIIDLRIPQLAFIHSCE
jgi:POTRA domain, FtsQ-type